MDLLLYFVDLLHGDSHIPSFLLYLRMEKLIGSVLPSRVDERRIGSNLLYVRTITGHWLYPVHFPFLPSFWGETEGDQHKEC